MSDVASAKRECPACGAAKVCSIREAQEVYRTFDYIEDAAESDATHVCTSCHRVRIDGTWRVLN